MSQLKRRKAVLRPLLFPAHVLLSIDEYRRLTGLQMTLADALAQENDGISSSTRLG